MARLGNRLGTVAHAEFLEDLADVPLGCAQRDHELRRDLLIGKSLTDQAQHLELGPGESCRVRLDNVFVRRLAELFEEAAEERWRGAAHLAQQSGQCGIPIEKWANIAARSSQRHGRLEMLERCASAAVGAMPQRLQHMDRDEQAGLPLAATRRLDRAEHAKRGKRVAAREQQASVQELSLDR